MLWFGRIIKTLLLLVVLLLAALLYVVFTLDLNAYKSQLSQVVEEHTGRELSLEGDIAWSWYPRLGLSLDNASLSNAPGFGQQPFASVERIRLHLAILPLLKQQIEVDKIVLDGLNVDLQRKASGETNWDDLVKSAAPAEAPTDNESSETSPEPNAENSPENSPETSPSSAEDIPAFVVSVGGVALHNTQLRWRDAQNGQDITLKKVNFDTGALALDNATDLRLSLETVLRMQDLDVQTALDLKTAVFISTDTAAARLDDLELALDALVTIPEMGVQKVALQFAADQLALGESSQLSLVVDAALQQAEQRIAAKMNVASQVWLSEDFQTIKLDGIQFDLDAALQQAEQALNTQLQLAIQSVLAENFQTVTVQAVNADIKAQADTLPNGQQQVALSIAQINAQLEQQHVDIQQVVASVLQLSLAGNVQLADFAAPKVTGDFQLARFSPRELLQALAIPLPETADKNVLQSVDLAFELAADTEQARINNLRVNLDQSQLNGELAVSEFAQPAIFARLNLDKINADAYLPPPPPEPEAPVEPEAKPPVDESAPLPIPVELLRDLNLDLAVTVGALQIMKLQTQALELALQAKDGVVKLSPAKLALYDGTVQAGLTLNAQQDEPKIALSAQTKGVKSGALLKDFMDDALISGALELDTELQTQGISIKQFKQQLDGDLKFVFRDGSINESKLADKIREIISKLDKDLAKQNMRFSELSGSVQLAKGEASNQDLRIYSQLFQAKGEGIFDLKRNYVDYTLSIGESRKKSVQVGFIPLRVHGPLADLKFTLPDWEQFKQKIDAELAKQKARLQQAIDEKKAQAEKAIAEQKAKLAAEKAKAEAALAKKKAELEAKKREAEAKAKAELAAKQRELEAKAKAEEARLKAKLEAEKKKKEDELKAKLEREKEQAEEQLEQELKNQLNNLFR